MFDKIGQLMEMKKQADRLKKELDVLTSVVEAVPGIKITISGSQNFQSVEVDEQLLKQENKQRFEADLLRSLNAAMKEAQTMAAQKMYSVMPGM